jgi:hypothetical protein
MSVRRRLRDRETGLNREPNGRSWNRATRLDAGIILGAAALGLGCVVAAAEIQPPVPHEHWFFDRSGGADVYGMSIAAVGLLFAKAFSRFRPVSRESPPWTDPTGLFLTVVTGAFIYRHLAFLLSDL